jgi:hypothetical protein
MLRPRSKRRLGTIGGLARYRIAPAKSRAEGDTYDDALHPLYARRKLGDFEAYARALRQSIERCGGTRVAYYLPTKIAGPTNIALGLIDFPDLAAYQLYREKLLSDSDGAECLRRAEAAGCILNEDRSFVRKASA